MRSIRSRLLLAITSLLLLVLGGVVLVQAARERDQIRRFERDKAIALASGVSGSIGVMLGEENWNQIRNLEGTLLRTSDDLVYVLVSDHRREDEIVAALPSEFQQQRVPDMVEVSVTDAALATDKPRFEEAFLLREVEFPDGHVRGEKGERIVELSMPLGESTMRGDEALRRTGTLRMGVSLRDVDRAVVLAVRRVAGIGLAGLLVGLLASYALARRITAPILAVQAAAQRIAAGALDGRIDVTSNDEVGVLAAAFNTMAASLQHTFGKLEGTLRSFERFVPRKFLNVVAPEGVERIKVGSHASRTLTILFSDIRGYTTLSEGTAPIDVFKLLNHYLDCVGTPIGAHGGFIDKYIGDAVMALFDAETSDGALHAALGMRAALESFNATSTRTGRPHIETGIGIHRGEVIMGTIGFNDKIESTVVGDAVNVASRVEGLTKNHGCAILVTGEVIEALAEPSRFTFRLVDAEARAKGKAKSVALYELVGYA